MRRANRFSTDDVSNVEDDNDFIESDGNGCGGCDSSGYGNELNVIIYLMRRGRRSWSDPCPVLDVELLPSAIRSIVCLEKLEFRKG